MWLAIALLSLGCLVLSVALGFSLFYLWRFANIILLLEDDFSDAIEGLSAVEEALEKILKMQLFFDSKEVKLAVQEALSEVKSGRMTVNRLVQKLVERSKNKYTVVVEEDSPDALVERALAQRAQRLQNGLPPPHIYGGPPEDIQ